MGSWLWLRKARANPNPTAGTSGDSVFVDMFYIIGADHKEYGPSSADEIRAWIKEGRADGRTLGKAENTAEWKPLSAFPEFAGVTVATGSPPSPAAPPDYVPAPGHSFEIAACISRASVLLRENFALLAGATFLVWSIDFVLQLVPFANAFLRGVLYGGLCLIFLKRCRGEPGAIGATFAGLSGVLTQLMLAGFLVSLLTFVASIFCFLPGVYFFIAWIFAVPLVADKRLEFWSAMELSRKVTGGVWLKVFGLVLIVFAPSLLFRSYALVKAWLLLSSLMSSWMSAGALPDFAKMMPAVLQVARETFPLTIAAQVVLLFNLPLGLGALMYAYENIFGSRTTPAR